MQSRTQPSRRGVLAGLTALPVVSVAGCEGETEPADKAPTDDVPEPAPEREPEPAPWEPAEVLDEVAFAWSVQSGDATADSVLVSVRTTELEVGLVVMVAAEGQWQESSRQTGLVPVDGVVQLGLVGLPPDSAFRFVFTSADGARRSPVGRFRTALAEDGWRKIVFGATSCLGGSNPGWPNLGFVAEHELDFLLLLGDTIYADNEGDLTVEDYRARWQEALAVPTLRSATASTSVVATWDDHEVANDWVFGEGSQLQEGVTPERVAAAAQAFVEALPQRVGEGPAGSLWRSLRWGSVLELIVMDCRGERGEGILVSEAQLSWATERIRTSTARFKIVMVSIHATDHTALLGAVQDLDRWQGYPAQREALLAACEEAGGVLLVTGDMHYGAIQRVSPEGAVGEALWEVAAGPSGSDMLPVNAIAELKGGLAPQYEDIVEAWTWARFEVDPGLGTIRVQMIGDDGQTVLDRELAL
jgi:phosphodiesterase/alkaline phosphatase D-like protein